LRDAIDNVTDAADDWRDRIFPGLVSISMLPFVPMYRLGVKVHRRLQARGLRPLPLPSVLVGGLAVGGEGKTPLSSWIAGRLMEKGARPALLMRGYRGDEQILHAELQPSVPVICGADRHAGALQALEAGADSLVLDGGFQRTDLVPTVRVACVAVEHLTGSRSLLPAGRWREPLESLKRADLVVLTRKAATDAATDGAAREIHDLTGSTPPVLELPIVGFTTLDGSTSCSTLEIATRRVLACAGVGAPDSFFEQLERLGAYVARMRLRDHHHFSRWTLKRMVHKLGAVDYVVVTQKDAVKIRDVWPGEKRRVLVAELKPVWVGNGLREMDEMLDPLVQRPKRLETLNQQPIAG
jgi:tetraacyldisaccharide 4'-kinase